MKKLCFLAAAMCFCAVEVWAAKPISYIDEIRQLGYVAGQGLACRARKYHQYELLARALLVTKSPNDKAQQEAMVAYNEAKITSMSAVFAQDYAGCDSIVHDFNRQKIFNSVLYADGKIKLYDGKMLTPRKLYDASSLYKKDPNIYDNAYATYKKALAKAEKNRQNAKKLEFRDANYSRYADQFN